jgi:hypothetical protein
MNKIGGIQLEAKKKYTVDKICSYCYQEKMFNPFPV